MDNITPNFRRSEFECRCGCGAADVDMDLVEGLQRIRTAIQSPIIVTSGVRCVRWNKTVGGSRSSRHLFGEAADVRTFGVPPLVFFREIFKTEIFAKGGIGLYFSFSEKSLFTWAHVDIRRQRVRWAQVNGSSAEYASTLEFLIINGEK